MKNIKVWYFLAGSTLGTPFLYFMIFTSAGNEWRPEIELITIISFVVFILLLKFIGKKYNKEEYIKSARFVTGFFLVGVLLPVVIEWVFRIFLLWTLCEAFL